MYLPPHFAETRPGPLRRLIAEQPLGLLVTLTDAGLCADPLPFVLDLAPGEDDDGAGAGVLRCHVARANPVWREARTDVDSLVVFQGPQAYVSPSFYPSKAATGQVVPTWNYITVQARGRLRVVDDAPWVHALVTRLTDRHEAPRERPWAVTDAPAAYTRAMVGAIVGLEIGVASLVGKWKVSQNRTPADRAGVAAGLARDAATHRDADPDRAGQAAAMGRQVGDGPA